MNSSFIKRVFPFFFLAAFISLALFACQKLSKDVADVDRPANAPAYTQEFNPNRSPANPSPDQGK